MNNLKYAVKNLLDEYNSGGTISDHLMDELQIAYDSEEMQEKMDAITEAGKQNLKELLNSMHDYGVSFDDAAEAQSIVTSAMHKDEI